MPLSRLRCPYPMDPKVAETLFTKLTTILAQSDFEDDRLPSVKDTQTRAGQGKSLDFMGKSDLLNYAANEHLRRALAHKECGLQMMPSKKYSRASFRTENLPALILNPPPLGEIRTARVRGTVKLSPEEKATLLQHEFLKTSRSMTGVQLQVELNVWYCHDKTVIEVTVQLYQFHKTKN